MLDLIIDEFTVSSKKCRDVSLLLEVAEPLNLRAAYETRHPHDDLHRMLCGEGQPGHQQPAVACQLDVSAGCRKRRADRFGGCGSGRVFRQALDRRVVPMIVNLFAAADNDRFRQLCMYQNGGSVTSCAFAANPVCSRSEGNDEKTRACSHLARAMPRVRLWMRTRAAADGE